MSDTPEYPMLLPRKVEGAHPLDLQGLAEYWPGDANALAPWTPSKAWGLSGLAAGRPAQARVVAVLSCSTTMDLARDLAGEVLADPFDAVVSVVQSAGVGQAGKFWESVPGNLHVSFVLPEPPPGFVPLASMVLGMAVLTAFEDLGAQGLELKWPNDVLQNGRKVCGLLVRERSGLSVAGLGVNLVWSPDDEDGPALPAACLDFGSAQHPPGPLHLWAALVKRLRKWYVTLFKEYDPGAFVRLAQARLAWMGREVDYTADDAGTGGRGRIMGLAPDGGLVLGTDQGETVLHASTIRPAP